MTTTCSINTKLNLLPIFFSFLFCFRHSSIIPSYLSTIHFKRQQDLFSIQTNFRQPLWRHTLAFCEFRKFSLRRKNLDKTLKRFMRLRLSLVFFGRKKISKILFGFNKSSKKFNLKWIFNIF